MTARFAPPDIAVERRPDGSLVLRSREKLHPYARCLGEHLDHWAAAVPDRIFLAERDDAGAWRRLTYGAAWRGARAIGQALLDRGLSAARPTLILSGNGIDHALLTLGAMQAGIPVAPVSVAYSQQSRDFAKLRHICELVRPGLVFAESGAAFDRALAAVAPGEAELVVARDPPRGRDATIFADLLLAQPGRGVEAAYAAVGPDTVAKILFTSGSTGVPKGVVNTQRMLCANQQMIRQVWPFLAERPPVLVDWLPWNHTFGGNHNFNLVLANGGTLYIDEGKPAPGLFERSLANLREIAPTLSFNVPLGYAMLLDHLERDPGFARQFFGELDLLFYAAAALPQTSWERLERASLAARGERVPMISAWGATETAPMATAVHFAMERAGNIGLPPPGAAIKLAPVDGRLELRAAGPHVTPGYWQRDGIAREGLDEDGFWRSGDAARLVDEEEPARGVAFDGRLAENFKLSSGVWVNVGAVRVALIAACAPFVADAVIAGHDRAAVSVLLFPNLTACRAFAPEASADALLAAPALRAAIRAALQRHNAAATGSSQRIAGALLLAEPPSIDGNEITDKGYINQRAVLERRAALVARLYAAGDPDILRSEERG